MGILTRIRSKWQREASRRLCCRPWVMQNQQPLISFTFDDFPSSALHTAGPILAKHGINLQLAKVTTLGERVEDTFLISGLELQHNRAQIAIETELLQALNA
mgnify:CR=1 FL=1